MGLGRGKGMLTQGDALRMIIVDRAKALFLYFCKHS